MFEKVLKILLIVYLLLIPLKGVAGWLTLPEDEESTTTSQQSTEKKSTNVNTVNADTASQNDATVEMINIVKKDENHILVTWGNPKSIANFSIKIYRSTAVIDSSDKLTVANLLTTLTTKTNAYLDAITTAGIYYYAVIVNTEQGNTKTLSADQNYTTYGVKINPPKKLPVVKGLKGNVNSDGKVQLTWDKVSSNIIYRLYYSTNKIKSSSDLGDPIAERHDNNAIIALPEEGEYYFAVTIVNKGQENKKIVLGDNSLQDPIIYKIEKTKVAIAETNVPSVSEETNIEETTITNVEVKTTNIQPKTVKKVKVTTKDYDYIVLTIQRKYINEKKYFTAMSRIKKLLKDRNCPIEIQNQAKLMQGKIYYYQQEYKKSIKVLSKLIKIFPDEAEFWIGRASYKL